MYFSTFVLYTSGSNYLHDLTFVVYPYINIKNKEMLMKSFPESNFIWQFNCWQFVPLSNPFIIKISKGIHEI